MRASNVLLLCTLFVGCGGSVDFPAQEDAGASKPAVVLGAPCASPGALACNGAGQKLQLLCDGTRWVQNGVCAGSTLCDPRPGPAAGSCQEPIAECLAHGEGWSFCDGAVRRTCGADLLSTTDDTCASAARCAASTGATCAACVEGEHACDGDDLQVCEAGVFVPLEACAKGTCNADAGACAPAICAAGEWRCSGSTLQQCNEAGTEWSTRALCGGDCNAGAHRCDPCPVSATSCLGDHPRTCDASGAWVTGSACPKGCKDGACIAPCTPGEHRCAGDVLERCEGASGWVGTATCAAGTCDATSMSCGTKPGSCPLAGLRDCVGETPRLCNDALEYVLLAPCTEPAPVCFGGKCTATSVTTVMFPSKTSKVYDGASGSGPLNPTTMYSHAGAWVEESFPRLTPITSLDVSFEMVDDTTCPGITPTFDVIVNSVNVGTFWWVGDGTGKKTVTKTFSFPSIAPMSGTVSLQYRATTEIPTGCGWWGWVPGGVAAL